MNDYSTCPYRDIAADQSWGRAVAGRPKDQIDPGVIGAKIAITPETKIATAGSCFAQRISGALRTYGYNFFETEPAPKWLPAAKREAYGYGIFSARYGNIYTSLQLLQMLERCLGRFAPAEPAWDSAGRFLDPFRPRIVPTGYASSAEFEADRASHLRAVEKLFREMDVLVFTLGLTESWLCKEDGAAMPVCPGCGVGKFDADKYQFQNFGYEEVVDHLTRFMDLLREINPKAKVIFTVSPVALAATMEDHHVLAATIYSKSVLRVAAQTMANRFDNVCYFPSYEIITATLSNADYFAEDRRNVTEAGVKHVMRCFFRHFAGTDLHTMVAPEAAAGAAPAKVVCDEEELAAALAAQQQQRTSAS